MLGWALGLSLVTAVFSSSARAYTGNEIYADMQAQAGSYEASRALSYVRGAIDSANFFAALDLSVNKHHTMVYLCFPEGVTNGQAFDVVKKYLVDNPSERNATAATLTMIALARTWGCSPTPKPSAP